MKFIKALGHTISEFVQVGLIILGVAAVVGVAGLLAKLFFLPFRFGWNLIR